MTNTIEYPIHYPTMATVKEAAARFGVSPAYVLKLCRMGKIHYTIISSRKWLVNVDTLAEYFTQGDPVEQEPQVVNGVRRIIS